MLILLLLLSTPTLGALLFGFQWLNFTFNSTQDFERYFSRGIYKQCLPSGFQVNSLGEYFISLTREAGSEIPATLAKLVLADPQPLLQPFPSWWANDELNPEGFGSVPVFEIDLEDNFWLVDSSRFLLLKLNNSGFLLETYDFSKAADKDSSLVDMALDLDRGFGYISDTGAPGLIVVDMNANSSRLYLKGHYSVIPDKSFWPLVDSKRVYSAKPLSRGIGGIALSCDKRDLYYSPVTSQNLFAISTQFLRNPEYILNHSAFVSDLGYKNTASQGLAISEKNNMYLSDVSEGNVYSYEQMMPYAEYFLVYFLKHVMNDSDIIWPYTITFDNQRRTLLVLANQAQNYWNGSIDFLMPLHGNYNFWVFEEQVDDRSYFYRCRDAISIHSEIEIPVWIYALVSVMSIILMTLAVCAVKHYRMIKKRHRAMLFS